MDAAETPQESSQAMVRGFGPSESMAMPDAMKAARSQFCMAIRPCFAVERLSVAEQFCSHGHYMGAHEPLCALGIMHPNRVHEAPVLLLGLFPL